MQQEEITKHLDSPPSQRSPQKKDTLRSSSQLLICSSLSSQQPICPVLQSSESLEILLPKLHAQTSSQASFAKKEESIVGYLKLLGLVMKTDPLQKEKNYTRYLIDSVRHTQESSKFILINKANDIGSPYEDSDNKCKRQTSLEKFIKPEKQAQSDIGTTIEGNKFFQRRVSNRTALKVESNFAKDDQFLP